MHQFSMLTSHFLVLVYLSEHPSARVWELAKYVDLTERRVATVLHELAAAGYLTCERRGRRNHYAIKDVNLPHPLVSSVPVAAMLSVIASYQDCPFDTTAPTYWQQNGRDSVQVEKAHRDVSAVTSLVSSR